MRSRLPRRSLLMGSAAALAAVGFTGCIPSLGARKKPVVNVGLITYPGGGFNTASVPLLKAALAVTKAHENDYDINVNTITVTPPTPAVPSSSPPTPSKLPKLSEPLTVSALEQALDQDNPPDVVMFGSSYEFGYAVQKNLLQPIDSFSRADATFKASDYFPGAIKAASDQGQLCGLPLAVQPTVLQYDKRLFDAAHLDPPDSTWTWTTLLNAAKALTRPDADNGGQFALNLLNNTNVLPIFIWQNGGDVVSPDGRRSLLSDAADLAAIKFIYDLFHTYQVVAMPPQSRGGAGGPKPAVARAYKYQTGQYPPLMGAGGQRVAMNFVSFGGYYGFQQGSGQNPIRLAELPRGKDQATELQMNGVLAVTQKASDPKSAFQVMALLAKEMENDMNVPAYRPAAQNLSKLNPSVPEDDARVLVASLEYARSLPVLVDSILGQIMFQQIFQPIQQGDKTPEEITRDASQALDEALNQ
ncbi:MAG TPA: extracellular solute-binding protein [Chloroflexota bacterium]|nr:extracellular solute-binding protein [Chloroflexota bacterium]